MMRGKRPARAVLVVWCTGFAAAHVPMGAHSQSSANLAGPIDCVIEPYQTIKLASPVQGLVDGVNVTRGDRVRKGEKLAHLELGVEQAAVDAARIRATSDVAVRSNQAAFKFQKNKLGRHETLKDQQWISTALAEEVRRDEEMARLKVAEAELDQKLAGAELERAEQMLNKRSILSPIDGIVVDRFLSPGEWVYEQAPILKLAQIDILNVEVFVPTALYREIRTGMSAKVHPQEPIGGSYNARVKVVDQVLDAASGTFRVRLELPNADLLLPGGIRCKMFFDKEPLN